MTFTLSFLKMTFFSKKKAAKINNAQLGSQELPARLQVGMGTEALSQGPNKPPVQPRANAVLTGEAGAQRGAVLPLVLLSTWLHHTGAQAGNWRVGSTRGTKVTWRLEGKNFTAEHEGRATAGGVGTGRRGAGGCGTGSPGGSRVIPRDGHRATGDIPSQGLVMVQSDTTATDTSPNPALADTLLLLQQSWCFHQNSVTGASCGSIRAAPTPLTPAEGLILPRPQVYLEGLCATLLLMRPDEEKAEQEAQAKEDQ